MSGHTLSRPLAYAGLDLLATAVLVLDRALRLCYVNSAAEQLFGVSHRTIVGQPVRDLFVDAEEFRSKLLQSLQESRGFVDQTLVLRSPATHQLLYLNCIVTPVDAGQAQLVIEFRHIQQQLRIEREAQRMSQAAANRELIRNLAHEIKNPLGGLRGSAQLLERELERPELREYTQVIIKEADRLQALMDRLLTPHRPRQLTLVNIHEVCERVRSLILAEFPEGISIRRSYDVSLPDFRGDREQIIQAVLNIVRNAAQAMTVTRRDGAGEIQLRTGVARHVTLARTQHRLALELQVTDNGPGIPAEIRERIFYPLVSGREGGSGLGLTLAQTFIQHHEGVIEVESQPGRTSFRIVLPLQ
ncbi:MAG: PAS domain-containing sensor histidine kinase [Betaproteobacteria bacterium RIFCSPLOWO2_12_FULL_66_14]|nr:MAG: PAS domain-containing sensor histidine kinase [Betaproteobacteria bacterium RIFCSPLOWO2_12_FULL_66_14]